METEPEAELSGFDESGLTSFICSEPASAPLGSGAFPVFFSSVLVYEASSTDGEPVLSADGDPVSSSCRGTSFAGELPLFDPDIEPSLLFGFPESPMTLD